MIFELDGMACHTNQTIRKIAWGLGNGYAPCLNRKGGKKRDLSAILGAHPRTIAVFYVLDAAECQQEFFSHQSFILSSRADEEGPITLSRDGGVQFSGLENCINTWVPMHSERSEGSEMRKNDFRLKVPSSYKLDLINFRRAWKTLVVMRNLKLG